jgi:hypothetical protein
VERAGISGIKREYLQERIKELAMNSKNKDIREE